MSTTIGIAALESKSGINKPDEHGYYDIILGAVNFTNSKGEFYAKENFEELVTGDSILNKRLKQGYLYAELTHPSREEFISVQDGKKVLDKNAYFRRLLSIDMKNTASHIKEITLDDTLHKINSKIPVGALVSIGKVKPFGVHERMAAESLRTPSINSAYSVRGFTHDVTENDRVVRYYKELVNYDFVPAPGISIANKFDSPATEQLGFDLTLDLVTSVLDDVKNNTPEEESLAMEANVDFLENLIIDIKSDDKQRIPSYLRWE